MSPYPQPVVCHWKLDLSVKGVYSMIRSCSRKRDRRGTAQHPCVPVLLSFDNSSLSIDDCDVDHSVLMPDNSGI